MGKPTGFMDFSREDPPKRPVEERIHDYAEIEGHLTEEQLEKQAARCMDCGVPFCHAFGCVLANRVPDWNDAVYHKQWRRALDLLHETDPFPEFTGRVCPAPCETACTLSLNLSAVSIKHVEMQIVEKGWREGWIGPLPAEVGTGKRVAVIGSGPAGLAAAQRIARYGHDVVVFEKADKIGGILRYGIPDFKMEKWVIDRRLRQMVAEGVAFEKNVEAGVDLSVHYLRRTFDAFLIAVGAGVPRDLPIEGRLLGGIHFAMDYLSQQNGRNSGNNIPFEDDVTAAGKHVVVIGGGDTGSDCVGTARRQGAKSVAQLELLPKPPEERPIDNPWPTWPLTMRSTSSHEEGCERIWSVSTKEFVGEKRVERIKCVKIDWANPDELGRGTFKEVPGSDFELPADLVLLAMGFVHPEHGPLVVDSALRLDQRGNIIVDENHMTSTPGVFSAGDAVIGASLVVKAIAQGQRAADGLHRYLAL